MAYTQFSLSRLTSEIVDTLSDPNGTYWSASEVQYAVQEAMREWSGITSYWRERGNFSATPPPPYLFDLSSVLASLRPRTITVDSLVREIQFHLLEPSTGIVGTGMSQQFTVQEMIEAVIHARNRFALDARIPLQVTNPFTFSNAQDGRFFLDPSVIYLHRLVWIDSNGVYTTLHRSDEWSQDSASLGTLTWASLNVPWSQENVPWSGFSNPVSFSQAVSRPTEVRLWPPVVSGTLEVVSVNSLDVLASAVTTSTTLGIPDDFCHAVKYLAMAELLSTDAESSNPFLADYSRFRYESIVQAALSHRSVIRVQVSGNPLPLSTLFAADTIRKSWQNSKNPQGAVLGVTTAYDLVGLFPPPVSNVSVDVDVVRSAPVPAADGIVLMGPEEIDDIISYCQHYLSFKLGGSEFRQTFPVYDKFQRHALHRNSVLSNQSRYLSALFEKARADEGFNPDISEYSEPKVPQVGEISQLWESRRQIGGAR